MPSEFYQSDPGQRQTQVERKAKALARLAGMHEKSIEYHGPGDVNVNPRMNVILSGTGSAWDQSYVINTVTFVFDEPEGIGDNGGSTMTIEASNDSAAMQQALDADTTSHGGGPEGDGANAGPVGTPGTIDSSTGSVVPQSSGWDEKGFE